jgi:predicted MPP superfamily phosphohydrolase
VNKKRFVCRGVSGIVPIILVFIIYGVWIEPNQLEVHHVRIQDDYLGKVLGQKVVVQISDLHIGTSGRRERRLLKVLDELKPDIIFLTGDYVQWNGDYGPALDFLSRLQAKTGIWAVMGDYDYSNSRKSCLFCHMEGRWKPDPKRKIRFLRNDIERVSLDNGSFLLGGVDIEAETEAAGVPQLFLPGERAPAILLSHEPLFFDRIRSDRHILMLAGDTHGGQVPLPSWLWKILGYKKNALYSQGLFERGRKKMFVSRGIGTSHIPFRLFRRPEIAVLHFVQ